MKRVLPAIVSTVTALVLLLSFKTHGTAAVTTSAATVSSTGSSDTSTTSSGSGGKGGSGGHGPSRSSSASSSGNSVATTYTGSAATTQYGPVQVRITVKNGTVTAANAVEYPNSDPRDAQINSYAIPALNSEATAASNSSIDMISGATYTSEGYISSLQSALDKAGL